MTKELALFQDYFRMVKPSEKQVTEWKDSFQSNSLSSGQRRGLEVTFEATHSGMLNDNMRFYLPSRMRDGADTFIKRNKPAKILKHHNDKADPVGKITGSEYVSTIPDFLEHNKDVRIMSDSSNSIAKQVNAANRFMKSGIPFEEGFRGLGYLRLKGVLLDPQAIDQVETGLFDAVSTSFRSPGQVFCSECAQNWASDGLCEHSPGEVYSDEEGSSEAPMGLIAGQHLYDELSLVVFDGDPITAIEIGHQDSKKIFQISEGDWNNSSDANNFEFSFRDFKEDIVMAYRKVELSDAEKEVLEIVKKLRPELQDDKVNEFAKTIFDTKTEDGKYPQQKDTDLDDETSVKMALEMIEAADQVIDGDKICDEMQVELKAMLDEELITKEVWEAADAQLSPEQRVKLSDSTFCGPERSFPVPDAAHVTAARRYLDRYEGEYKAVILASVAHKAIALGCDSQEDSSSTTEPQPEVKFEVPSSEVVSTLDDSQVKELFNAIESQMITRNLKLDRPCGKCATHEDEANRSKDELKVNEEKMTDLNLQLTILREELRFQISDYMAQVDRFVSLGAELHTAKKDHLALVGTMTGRYADMTKAIDSLNDADFTKEEAIVMADFKVEDVIAKLNDGMTNTPNEPVDDPTANNDADNGQIPDGLTKPAIAAIDNIRDFIKESDIFAAKDLYAKMVSMKVLDMKLVPFESLSAENAEEILGGK